MKRVTVLMSTYNGEKYLEEQIRSILNQNGVEVSLIVRDDGSNDSTLKILEKYKKMNKLEWYCGDNLKSAYSFLNLINYSKDSDYYAFSDQDDVWNNDKLITAVNSLEKFDSDIPVLYCSNYQLVDENLNKLKDNHHVSTTLFNEALVSSCCTGCTMVFNLKLKNIIRNNIPNCIVMHDDWIHKVCLAIDGKVIYDSKKTILYRQHGNNVDAGIHSFKHKMIQIIKRLKSKECIRVKQLSELYNIYGNMMCEKNRTLLNKVIHYKEYNIIKRIQLLFSYNLKTPYRRLNRGFRFAIIFRYF